MKKLLLLLCSLFLVFSVATGASALYFELDHFDVNLRNTDPGLVVNWAPELATPVGGNLDLGAPVTVDLFSIWTNEGTVNKDDKVPYGISVDFYFTQPNPFFGSVSGLTFGKKILFGLSQGGKVEWNGPSILDFGESGGDALLITLSDESFNWGIFGTFPGECLGATVEATFELINEGSAPVPEPATMLLLGTGLVGIAGVRSKKLLKNK